MARSRFRCSELQSWNLFICRAHEASEARDTYGFLKPTRSLAQDLNDLETPPNRKSWCVSRLGPLKVDALRAKFGLDASSSRHMLVVLLLQWHECRTRVVLPVRLPPIGPQQERGSRSYFAKEDQLRTSLSILRAEVCQYGEHQLDARDGRQVPDEWQRSNSVYHQRAGGYRTSVRHHHVAVSRKRCVAMFALLICKTKHLRQRRVQQMSCSHTKTHSDDVGYQRSLQQRHGVPDRISV